MSVGAEHGISTGNRTAHLRAMVRQSKAKCATKISTENSQRQILRRADERGGSGARQGTTGAIAGETREARY
jgi:hypothetical protein